MEKAIYEIVKFGRVVQSGTTDDLWPKAGFPPGGPSEAWLTRHGARLAHAAREPRWQEFRSALRAIPEIKSLLQMLSEQDQLAFLGLGVGLGQAAQGDISTFMSVWAELLDAGVVPSDLATAVQALAAEFDLPVAFVKGLKPA